MFRHPLFTLAAALLFAVPLTVASAADDPFGKAIEGLQKKSYLLTCRPGPGMIVDYRGGDNTVIVNYKRGTAPASSGVAAGVCTWADRGLRSHEPARFCQGGVVSARFIMDGDKRITTLTSTQATYLAKILAGQVFHVYVYSDGSCMVVTRIGP
jgi:hypothetical protein